MIMDKRVRSARPRVIAGSPETAAGPAFSTVMGLVRYAAKRVAEGDDGAYRPTEEPLGRFGRIGQWLRENF